MSADNEDLACRARERYFEVGALDSVRFVRDRFHLKALCGALALDVERRRFEGAGPKDVAFPDLSSEPVDVGSQSFDQQRVCHQSIFAYCADSRTEGFE